MTTAQQLIDKGFAQGRAEGRADGQRNALRRLLEHRFGPLSDAHAARLDAATPEELDRWIIAILDASSIDEALS